MQREPLTGAWTSRRDKVNGQDWQMPNGFIWGAATASYQIEGAVHEDGRGESIWDRFSHTPGKTENGDTGDVACDHYHRMADDVGIMKELGLHAYRFSIAWPRILPEGTGAVNAAGLDFYDRLVDRLLKERITPFVTLYHWDLPQALQDRGGWANRATVEAFRTYADVVSKRLGDRVRYWITHNEPWVAAMLGNLQGLHAPGIRDLATSLQVAHHLLLSHGVAVPVLRANSDPSAAIGITLNLNSVEENTGSEEDRAAAYREHAVTNRWFLDPLFRGRYPEITPQNAPMEMVPIRDGDLEQIRAPIDFLGVNNYFRTVVKAGPTGDGSDDQVLKPEFAEYTTMGWEVFPDGFYNLLTRLQRDYQPPALYVTENGAAFADTVGDDGKVHDPRREHYIREYLRAAHRAIADGVNLQGYFVWSLLDNFEWAYGYSQRFGITYVDYPTQQRIIKNSGRWYARAIAANGPVD
jgi:beta-glucosidase